MKSFAEIMYPDEPKQTCICCNRVSPFSGWQGLCNRSCYHDLIDLLESYENGEVSEPDMRIVKYFTRYPKPEHSFFHEKISAYITSLKKSKED